MTVSLSDFNGYSVIGIETSHAVCIRDNDKEEMTADKCNISTKPTVTTRSCKRDDCLSKFYWDATHGHCIAQCGPGKPS